MTARTRRSAAAAAAAAAADTPIVDDAPSWTDQAPSPPPPPTTNAGPSSRRQKRKHGQPGLANDSSEPPEPKDKLTHLSSELLDLIINHLSPADDPDLRSLANLCLVSRGS